MPDLPALLEDYAAEPAFWTPTRLGTASAWWGHVPFAHWLVAATRPRLVVELGTQGGVSFSAFCEAVRRQGLPARCVAVDTWQGDAHSGFYGEHVYRDLAAFVARTYADIAELRRSLFSDALAGVADGSIDLLHIDGRHRYEDVCADYAGWRRKLSPRAIVLVHDIAETREDFGVHRFWAELTRTAPSFAFHHSHGLGVLAPGPHPPEAAELLCARRNTDAADTIRARFAALGERWKVEAALRDKVRQAQAQAVQLARLQSQIETLTARRAAGERPAVPSAATA